MEILELTDTERAIILTLRDDETGVLLDRVLLAVGMRRAELSATVLRLAREVAIGKISVASAAAFLGDACEVVESREWEDAVARFSEQASAAASITPELAALSERQAARTAAQAADTRGSAQHMSTALKHAGDT